MPRLQVMLCCTCALITLADVSRLVQYASLLAECSLVGEALAYSAAALALAAKAKADRKAPPLLFNAADAVVTAHDLHLRLQTHAAAVGVAAAAASGARGSVLMKRVGSFLDSKVMQLMGDEAARSNSPATGRSGSTNALPNARQGTNSHLLVVPRRYRAVACLHNPDLHAQACGACVHIMTCVLLMPFSGSQALLQCTVVSD